MNRKHNPFVSLAALLLAAVILALTCTGCYSEATEKNDGPAVITEETEPAPLEPVEG